MYKILSEDFPLVANWINELRDVAVQTDRMRFRRNIERVGEVASLEISKLLPMEDVEVKTPLDSIKSERISQQPVVTTILRAGIPLFNGILNYFDHADCGFVAAYRKHETNDYFSIKQDYLTCPDLEGRPLIVADPMLATGASLVEALKDLLKQGTPSQLHIVAVIASEEGVSLIQEKYPEAHLWIGVVDPKLTDQGYITPGLGDAGDLSFGHKLQK